MLHIPKYIQAYLPWKFLLIFYICLNDCVMLQTKSAPKIVYDKMKKKTIRSVYAVKMQLNDVT